MVRSEDGFSATSKLHGTAFEREVRRVLDGVRACGRATTVHVGRAAPGTPRLLAHVELINNREMHRRGA